MIKKSVLIFLILIFCFITVNLFSMDLYDGLTVYYQMNNNADSYTKDNAEYGKIDDTGFLYGAKWSSGVCGKGVYVNGTSKSYLYAKHSEETDMAGKKKMSVAVWVKPDGAQQSNDIIFNKEGEYEVAFRDSKRLKWALTTSNHTTWKWIYSNLSLNLNQWNLVVFTYDGKKVRLYVNGSQNRQEWKYKGTIAVQPKYAKSQLRLGQRTCCNTPMKGWLDEFRLYSRVLDKEEIDYIYNNTPCSPVADYRFDECEWNGEAEEVSDSSGNNFNITTINDVETEKGKICKAALFNGSNKIQGKMSYKFNNAVTLSAWFKTTEKQKSYVRIVEFSNSSGDYKYGTAIAYDSTGKIVRGWTTGKDGKRSEEVSFNLSSGGYHDGNWHHIAYVYNGKEAKLYVDGVVQASVKTNIKDIFDAKTVVIGGYYPDNKHDFKGSIDEVKIFNRALTEEQITEIFKNEKSGKNWDGSKRECKICTPVVYFNMEEGSGGKTADIADEDFIEDTGYLSDAKWTSGICGNGIYVNGKSKSYIFAKDSSETNMDSKNEMSVSIWVKPDGAQQNNDIIFNKEGEYEVAFRGSNSLKWALTTSDHTTWYWVNSTLSLDINKWNHVVFTYDGNKVRLYVNGSKNKEEWKYTGTITAQPKYSKSQLRLGQRTCCNTPMKGWLDEFKLYEKRLTASEIDKIYNETPCSAVADWRFEECSFNGIVKDSSDYGFDGKVIGDLDSKTGEICQSGYFEGSKSYVSINDSDVFDKTSQLTIMFWFNAEEIHQSNGTNARGIISKRVLWGNNESYGIFFWNGKGKKIWVDIDGTNDRFSSKTEFSENKWYHTAVVFDGRLPKDKRVKVYVNGILDSVHGETSSSIPDYNSNVYIGNLYSGNSLLKVFKGKIDEVKIFGRALTEEQITEIFKNEKSGKNWDGSKRECNSCYNTTPLDHIKIEDKGNDGMAIACKPELVCFTAKDKNDKTIENYTGEIKTGSFLENNSKGKWYKKYSGFTNPDPPVGDLINEGESTSGYVFKKEDKGSYCIFLENKHLESDSEKLTILAKSADEGTEDKYTLKFFKAGFVMYWDEEKSEPWNKQISCKDTWTNPRVNSIAYLKSVTTNDKTGECETLFQGYKNLKGRIVYIDPSPDEITGKPVLKLFKNEVGYSKSDSPDEWDDVKLEFDNGIAKLNMTYNDAGKVKLEFAYDLDSSQKGYEMVMLDSHNEIVFSPFGLYPSFDDIDNRDSSNAKIFKTKLRAGADKFLINVRGVCYDSNDDKSPKDGFPDKNSDLSDNKMPLPNFKSSVALRWIVANPASGSGNLEPNEIPEKNFVKGVGTISPIFTDVGVLMIDQARATDYIFKGNNIAGWPLHKYVGKYIPHHYIVLSHNNGTLKENCSSFNYTGEGMSYLSAPSFQIAAENKNNKITSNYKDDFFILTSKDITVDYPNEDDNAKGNNGTNLRINFKKAAGKLFSNKDGTATYIFGNDVITYLREKNSKIAQFSPKFTFKVSNITDSDGIKCIKLPYSISVTGQLMKYGKFKIFDNYGPETEPLKLKTEVLYWDGNEWKKNSDDALCTVLKPTMFVLKNFTKNLNKGETSVTGSTGITSGEGSLLLSAPGTNNYGSVSVDLSSSSDYYNYLYENDTEGKATFGNYRGRDRIIMWEEVPAD